jgi:RNA polymerase sigma-70 factor, ECF subfamily
VRKADRGLDAAADAPAQAQDDVVSLEQRLVSKAQAGDRKALQVLLARHADALYSRIVLPRTGDRAVAEDIVKDTMVTAIEKLDTFRWRGRSIYFWLRQIAVNKVIDHHRRTGRAGRLAQSIANEPELSVLPSPSGPGPEAALIAKEEQQRNAARIRATLEQMNPRYRKAVELRLVEERPREECAQALEVSVGTFDVLFFRAVRAFRKTFEESA